MPDEPDDTINPFAPTRDIAADLRRWMFQEQRQLAMAVFAMCIFLMFCLGLACHQFFIGFCTHRYLLNYERLIGAAWGFMGTVLLQRLIQGLCWAIRKRRGTS